MYLSTCETTTGAALHLERVQMEGRLVGRMADMTMEMQFSNPESVNVEVLYSFALPWRAFILGLEVEMNGERLAAVVKGKSVASEEYEDAIAEGNTAVLVNISPLGSYHLQLGNLMAHGACIIRLRYSQPLDIRHGCLRLTIPTNMAPRYGDAVRDGGFDAFSAPVFDAQVEYPFDIRLYLAGELTGSRVGSPSHHISIGKVPSLTSASEHELEVRLASQAWLDRDFVLTLEDIAQRNVAVAALDKLDEEHGVVLASLVPQLPQSLRTRKPVNLKVLVDCSGSMAGDSIESARSALLQMLSELGSADRVSLSRFGNTFEHQFRSLKKVTKATQASGGLWVQKLEADMGGTAMEAALRAVMELDASRSADILMVTDGHIYAVDSLVEMAQASKQRVFVVGVGSAVSEDLLRRLAYRTGGSCELLAPGEPVAPAVLRITERMRSASILQPTIRWPQGLVIDSASEMPQQIYEGDDLQIYARFTASSLTEATKHPTVTLVGYVEGDDEELTLAECSIEIGGDDSATLARIVAYENYKEIRTGLQTVDEILAAGLIPIAEKYQLLTEDTSMVLVKHHVESEKAEFLPELRRIKMMVAAGWGALGSVKINKPSDIFYSPEPYLDSRDVVIEGVKEKPMREFKNYSTHEEFSEFGDKLYASNEEEAFPQPEGLDGPDAIDYFMNDGSLYKDQLSNWIICSGQTPVGYLEFVRENPKMCYGRIHLWFFEVPLIVRWWLDSVIERGYAENKVIDTFKAVLLEYRHLIYPNCKTHIEIPESHENIDQLHEYMRTILSGVTTTKWPKAIIDFEESDIDSIPAPHLT